MQRAIFNLITAQKLQRKYPYFLRESESLSVRAGKGLGFQKVYQKGFLNGRSYERTVTRRQIDAVLRSERSCRFGEYIRPKQPSLSQCAKVQSQVGTDADKLYSVLLVWTPPYSFVCAGGGL